ncbi:MAG: Preprotein translocase subunit SecG (TC 3.A.5.1.1) [uncultured Thiotrichaceae bacterium]|uniref:Protein-export membrane protein SecG n=1 Tax=uncultured Thiotrichaceae bacterium TaxID=298394 RepID=A0A6S6SHK9_9GAMM|nr:MAG: Preprotein translocase subunit SecG (TC 3.A.5.1.1) [uncultured Thiotrichaceae bacterium]
MFYNILLIVQIIVAIGVIVLVLMQHGKGADAGAAFGSGASGTVFGSQGSANFLSRATAILATVFFLNSMSLAWLVANRTTEFSSVVDAFQTEETVPAQDVPSDIGSEVPAVPGQEASSSDQASEVPAPQGEAPAATEASEVPAAPKE